MPKILGASEWSQRAAGHDDPLYLGPDTPGFIEAIDREHLPKLDHKPKTTGSPLAEERDFVRAVLKILDHRGTLSAEVLEKAAGCVEQLLNGTRHEKNLALRFLFGVARHGLAVAKHNVAVEVEAIRLERMEAALSRGFGVTLEEAIMILSERSARGQEPGPS